MSSSREARLNLAFKELFTCGTQNTWPVAHSMCYRPRRYISIRVILKPVKRLRQISGMRIRWPSKKVLPQNEFESFVLFSIIRSKEVGKFFIRDLLEVFYFPSAFIVVTESF